MQHEHYTGHKFDFLCKLFTAVLTYSYAIYAMIWYIYPVFGSADVSSGPGTGPRNALFTPKKSHAAGENEPDSNSWFQLQV